MVGDTLSEEAFSLSKLTIDKNHWMGVAMTVHETPGVSIPLIGEVVYHEGCYVK